MLTTISRVVLFIILISVITGKILKGGANVCDCFKFSIAQKLFTL